MQIFTAEYSALAMRDSKKVVVVVPVHTAAPTEAELVALKQCCHFLSLHPVVLVHPQGMDVSKYLFVYPDIACLAIPPYWQESIAAYNRLKCSSYFYSLFAEYEYLLTYELDAYVFKDELREWCERGYSYIGAPWFEGYGNALPSTTLMGVGNSGFSLRNIKTCLNILQRIKELKFLYRILSKLALENAANSDRILNYRRVKGVFKIRDTQYLSRLFFHPGINEDLFWGKWVSETFYDFKIADPEEAIKFSFELNPEILFEMNHHQLPFGCHAWLKHNPAFWSRFIDFTFEDQKPAV